MIPTQRPACLIDSPRDDAAVSLSPSQTWRTFLANHVLRRILARSLVYYHRARTRLALDKDAPDAGIRRAPPSGGAVAVEGRRV
jgi:hypothetical protein